MALTLTGTEELTIEVFGTLPKDRARTLIGDVLPVELVKGQVPVSLLVFQMKGLRAANLPGPGMNYGEALWRVGVLVDRASEASEEGERDGRPKADRARTDREPAWFGLVCDIDNVVVRKSGGWLVRYPTRTATFHFEGSQARGAVDFTAGGKRCAVYATPTLAEPPEAAPPRRLVVRNANAMWEVPWGEEPAPFRRAARIAFASEELAEETFGNAVRFLPEGLLHRGRVHHCGVAKKLS